MNRNRLSLLALPVSMLALVACSSSNETQSAVDAGNDDAPDTIPMDAGDDAPDTVPMDTGVDGSVDAPGPKPEGWDTDYALPGLAGEPTAIAASVVVTPKRWIYVGGSFHHAGSVPARNVAVWNGLKWIALGAGLPGEVTSVAANDEQVYAVAHHDGAWALYHWNKSEWVNLDAGADEMIKSIDLASDGTLWVAGHFTKIGGKSIRGVARYKDGAFSAPGALINNGFEVVRATSTGACVGGNAEDMEVGVACFNGTTWTNRKSNIKRGSVKALRMDGKGNLIAGGQFWTSDEFEVPGSIARFNAGTSKWELIGGGVTNALGGPGDVLDVAAFGDKVYVTGRIAGAGGINVRHIALWDGKKWLDLEGGIAKEHGLTFGDAAIGHTLAVDDGGELYAGGKLTRAGDRNAMYIGHFNGTKWAPVDDPTAIRRGINGITNAVVASNDGKVVYAGGNFRNVGGDVVAHNIARLDASGWKPLGDGTNDAVTGLAVKGDELYAVGWFTGIGNTSTGEPIVAASYVAKWDATKSAWSALGAGLDGQGRAVAIAPDGKVWVAGSFTKAGSVESAGVAVWDGSKWSGVAGGVADGLSTRVAAIAFHDGKTYIGGDFSKAGGKDAKNIAVWDGTTWAAVGAGFDGPVDSLVVYNGKLVAGGAFNNSGTTKTRHLAEWNGTAWTELGGGLTPVAFGETVLVQSMAVRGGELFIAGLIEKAGAVSVSHVARLSGGAWSPLGGGVNDVAEGVWASPDSLWVAGTFSGAGGVGSVGIARYWFAK